MCLLVDLIAGLLLGTCATALLPSTIRRPPQACKGAFFFGVTITRWQFEGFTPSCCAATPAGNDVNKDREQLALEATKKSNDIAKHPLPPGLHRGASLEHQTEVHGKEKVAFKHFFFRLALGRSMAQIFHWASWSLSARRLSQVDLARNAQGLRPLVETNPPLKALLAEKERQTFTGVAINTVQHLHLLHSCEVCGTMSTVARELFKGPSTFILWDLEDSSMLGAAAPCCIL